MSVDLRTCKPGDKLLSKHGMILTYIGPLPDGHYFDHEVMYPNGGRGTRTNNGATYRAAPLQEDHDIVQILGQGTDAGNKCGAEEIASACD
jgi:hypothetical protein